MEVDQNEILLRSAVANLSSRMKGESVRNITIYLLWCLGYTQKEIAPLYDIHHGRVSTICKQVQKNCKRAGGLSQICSKGVVLQ